MPVSKPSVRNMLRYGFLMLCVCYIVFVLVYTYGAFRQLTNRVESELGNKAMVLAISIAQNVKLDQAEVQRLSSLEFNDLLKDETNVRFEQQARQMMDSSDIKYVYLEVPIAESQVKYYVAEDEVEEMGVPAGTPLDVIWLLDAVKNDEIRMEDTDGQWYSDRDHYTIMDENFASAYASGKPCYYVNTDRWGTYITGFAPYIDKDGEYIGMIGVDLFMDNYAGSLQQNRSLISVLIISSVFMGLLAAYLAVKLNYAEDFARQKAILSQTDPLTELYNRRHFLEQMEKEWAACAEQQRPLAFIIVDVDYLKEYNDNYGHLAGDRVLRHVGTVLARTVAETGGMVGRYGGDEFVISLPGMKRDEAIELSRRIGAGVCQWPREEESIIAMPGPTVSIGVAAVIPEPAQSMEDLIQKADRVLYMAKDHGRNRICCESDVYHPVLPQQYLN